jgi:hypothetical protein
VRNLLPSSSQFNFFCNCEFIDRERLPRPIGRDSQQKNCENEKRRTGNECVSEKKHNAATRKIAGVNG